MDRAERVNDKTMETGEIHKLFFVPEQRGAFYRVESCFDVLGELE